MANGRISRLSAFSDALKEDGKRRLSITRRDSKTSMNDVEASRTTDLEGRTIEGKIFFSSINCIFVPREIKIQLEK